jgi:hypothetical protein
MRKNIINVSVIVGLILLIPLFGTLFIKGWNWGFGDFVFAFVLLFGFGLAIDFAARKISRPIYRCLAISAIVLTLMLVWIELATGALTGN